MLPGIPISPDIPKFSTLPVLPDILELPDILIFSDIPEPSAIPVFTKNINYTLLISSCFAFLHHTKVLLQIKIKICIDTNGFSFKIRGIKKKFL